MRGKLYGVGVGPGDPEDMTLKAVRILRQCPVIAIPKKTPDLCVSYDTAVKAVPELVHKELVCVDVPMTKDRDQRERPYEEGARQIVDRLSKGQDVALLTIGDSTIYASDMYLIRLVKAMGYEVEMVNGVPSFCAAAARLKISLGEREEQIHILPGSYQVEEGLRLPGVKILMKTGRSYEKVKELLKAGEYEVKLAENCGMAGEKVYGSLEEMPSKAGYYSLMIVRDRKTGREP